jgi:hypothetical protein
MREFDLKVVVLDGNSAQNVVGRLHIDSAGFGTLKLRENEHGLLVDKDVSTPLVAWMPLNNESIGQKFDEPITQDNLEEIRKKINDVLRERKTKQEFKLVSDLYLWFGAGIFTIAEHGDRRISSQGEINSELTLLALRNELISYFPELERNEGWAAIDNS